MAISLSRCRCIDGVIEIDICDVEFEWVDADNWACASMSEQETMIEEMEKYRISGASSQSPRCTCQRH